MEKQYYSLNSLCVPCLSFAVKMENALIIFLKYPEPGKVKTRLAKALGDEKACGLQSLAENVIKNIFTKNPGTYDVHIFFTPADRETEIKDWLKPFIQGDRGVKTQFSPQEGRNLGERMSHAFGQILQEKDYKNAQCSELQPNPLKKGDEGGCKKFPRERKFVHNTIIIGTDWSGDRCDL